MCANRPVPLQLNDVEDVSLKETDRAQTVRLQRRAMCLLRRESFFCLRSPRKRKGQWWIREMCEVLLTLEQGSDIENENDGRNEKWYSNHCHVIRIVTTAFVNLTPEQSRVIHLFNQTTFTLALKRESNALPCLQYPCRRLSYHFEPFLRTNHWYYCRSQNRLNRHWYSVWRSNRWEWAEPCAVNDQVEKRTVVQGRSTYTSGIEDAQVQEHLLLNELNGVLG